MALLNLLALLALKGAKGRDHLRGEDNKPRPPQSVGLLYTLGFLAVRHYTLKLLGPLLGPIGPMGPIGAVKRSKIHRFWLNLGLPGLHTKVFNAWLLGRPQIMDFGGSGRPRRPGKKRNSRTMPRPKGVLYQCPYPGPRGRPGSPKLIQQL